MTGKGIRYVAMLSGCLTLLCTACGSPAPEESLPVATPTTQTIATLPMETAVTTADSEMPYPTQDNSTGTKQTGTTSAGQKEEHTTVTEKSKTGTGFSTMDIATKATTKTSATTIATTVSTPIQICWYDADLDARLRLARQYLYGILNADEEMTPYFGYRRTETGRIEPVYCGGSIGLPHVTGRALDALFNIEASLGEKTDPTIEKIYTDYFFYATDESLCVPVFLQDGRPYLETHNLREGTEGLAQLIAHRGSAKASETAQGLLNTLTCITSFETKGFSMEYAQRNLSAADFAKINGSLNHPAPVSSGRLVGALVQLYRATGNDRALLLAGMYAQNALGCFTDTGEMIAAKAGNHVHSITSTLSGVLYYALEEHNAGMIRKVKTIYENGFASKGIMSSYGWIKEQVNLDYHTDQGEVNQVGDMIQVQLGLATVENPALWYGRAESFMRGTLLPSQILNDNAFLDYKNPQGDAQSNMTKRVIGGWGFPTPVAHMENVKCAINTIDITQGAVQAICVFKTHIATFQDGITRVNLYFDADNEAATVKSQLPLTGCLQVVPKHAGALHIRIPDNIQPKSFTVTVDGHVTPFATEDGYAVLENVKKGALVVVTFTPQKTTYTEKINGTVYTVTRYGEQTTEVMPRQGLSYMHMNFPK